MKERMDAVEEPDETVAAARDWVLRLASDEVSASDLATFRAWLASAPAHRAAFDRERRFWHRLGGMRPAQSAADAVSSALRPPRGRRRMAALAAGLAACIALVAVFGGEVALSLRADYRTAEGELRTVTLPDGSLAHLNTDTALALAFDAGARRVELLRGEALFEVQPDAARPFRVAAVEGVSEAVGTAFVVRAAAEAAVVTVTEGRVRVTSPAPAGAGEPGPAGSAAHAVHALAGQRTAYRPGAAPLPPQPADMTAAAAWRRGVILIEDLPLDAALAELDRYRPGRIVLAAGGPLRSVSGAFDTGNIDAAIAGLAATHGLTVTEVTDYLVILR